jgi:hypothetical protein
MQPADPSRQADAAAPQCLRLQSDKARDGCLTMLSSDVFSNPTNAVDLQFAVCWLACQGNSGFRDGKRDITCTSPTATIPSDQCLEILNTDMIFQ